MQIFTFQSNKNEIIDREKEKERERGTQIFAIKILRIKWFDEPFRYTAMFFSRYSLIDRENKHVAEPATQWGDKPDKNDLK